MQVRMLPTVQFFAKNNDTPGKEKGQDENTGDQTQPGVYGE
jgi:hypothetical protein